MVFLPIEKRKKLAHFFENTTLKFAQASLEGFAGDVWADDFDIPSVLVSVTGDAITIGGNPGENNKEKVISHLTDLIKNSSFPYIVLLSDGNKWDNIIEEAFKDKFYKYMRYAVKKPEKFDIDKLKVYIERLPENLRPRPFTAEIFEKIINEPEAAELCKYYKNYEDFSRMNLNFAIFEGKDWYCAVSGAVIYDKGNSTEISIVTEKDHRRKGYALSCAAALISECVQRGIHPNWDAANIGSVHLAEKLGYKLSHEYPVYVFLPAKFS